MREHCLSTVTNTTKIRNSSVRTASRSFVSRGFRVYPVATSTRVTSSENLWKQEDFIRNYRCFYTFKIDRMEFEKIKYDSLKFEIV